MKRYFEMQKQVQPLLKAIKHSKINKTHSYLLCSSLQAVMQYDGNFLLMDQYRKNWYWATQTSGFDAALLYLQNDGNLVIKSAAIGNVLWATYTSANCTGSRLHSCSA